jgi:hypothetical protein
VRVREVKKKKTKHDILISNFESTIIDRMYDSLKFPVTVRFSASSRQWMDTLRSSLRRCSSPVAVGIGALITSAAVVGGIYAVIAANQSSESSAAVAVAPSDAESLAR